MSELINLVKILGAIGAGIFIFYTFALGIYYILTCITVKMVRFLEKFMEDF